MPFSSSNPYLLPKEIANSGDTLLNTDEVHYASFLNRIAEAVYDPWYRNVLGAIRQVGRERLDAPAYVTQIDLVLDP